MIPANEFIDLSTIQIPKSHPLDRFGERWHRSHSPSDRERIARRLLSDVNEIKKEPIWSTLSLINHGPGRFFVNRHDKSIVFVTNEEATVLVTVLNRKDRPRGWVDPLSPGKKRKKWR